MAAEHDENYYRPFFEYSMDAMLLTAPDGSILAANPAACALFEKSEDEICRGGRYGLVDASSPRLNDLLEERARTGKTRGELIFIRGDGTRFPGEVSSAEFVSADGKTKTVMIIRDLSEVKQTEQTLAQLLNESNKNAAELEAILESQEDIILMYDMTMNVVRANPAFIHNYGFDPVGINVKEIIRHVSCRYLDGRPLVLSEQPTPRALRGEKTTGSFYIVTRADGTNAIVETASTPLYVDGAVTGSVTIWHDITELKKTEEALNKLVKEVEDLYEHAPCGYHSLDKDGVIVRINETELAWLGYSRDEVIGKLKWLDIITPDSRHVFQTYFPQFLKQGFIRDVEFEIVRKDGTLFPGLINATAIYDADGNFVMSRSTVFDISDRKVSEQKMRYLANYDPLTDLPNRTLLFDRLQQVLSTDRRSKTHMALMFLDLDQFKPVNDTLGHDIGDLLLIEAAKRMRNCIRESDTVGRFGGDEFVVLLPTIRSEEDALLVAEKIRHILSQPFALKDRVLHISSSIGVAIYPEHGEDENVLITHADVAMYSAKDSGGNRVSLFRWDMAESGKAKSGGKEELAEV